MKNKEIPNTVLKMVELFKSKKPYESTNAYFLYSEAISKLENPSLSDSAFYWEFHEERKRQKIRIRRPNKGGNLCTGLPMHVDMFYRLPDKDRERHTW